MMMECSACGKRLPSGKGKQARSPIENHILAKHKGNAEAIEAKNKHEERDEDSMAQRHIDAVLDEAMGIPNYDREWLL